MARPVGSTESAERVMQIEMLAWAKTAKRIREMVDGQIDQFRQHLEQEVGLEQRLIILAALRDVLTSAVVVIEKGSKFVNTEQRTTEGGDEDKQKIMDSLLA